MGTPWVENSELAFLDMMLQDGNHVLNLQIIPKEEEDGAAEAFADIPPLMLEITFMNKNRQHQIKLAKLMRTYMDTNHELRSLAFFWIQMLKFKGLTNTTNGFLSESSYLIMLVSWLQNGFMLPKAQEGSELADNKKIELEKKSHTFDMKQAASLGG